MTDKEKMQMPWAGFVKPATGGVGATKTHPEQQHENPLNKKNLSKKELEELKKKV